MKFPPRGSCLTIGAIDRPVLKGNKNFNTTPLRIISKVSDIFFTFGCLSSTPKRRIFSSYDTEVQIR